jgi:hypothetical protein
MDSIITSLLFKTISYSFYSTSDKHDYPLEPLSVVIKLGLLFYSVEGCKLVIDKTVSIQEPTIYTPFLRTLLKSSRENIQLLNKPINSVLKAYSITNIEIILINAVRGLNTLKYNYRDSLAEQAIDLYIQQIKQALTTKEENKGRRGNWEQEHIDIIERLFISLETAKKDGLTTNDLLNSVINIVQIYE